MTEVYMTVDVNAIATFRTTISIDVPDDFNIGEIANSERKEMLRLSLKKKLYNVERIGLVLSEVDTDNMFYTDGRDELAETFIQAIEDGAITHGPSGDSDMIYLQSYHDALDEENLERIYADIYGAKNE